MSLSRAQVEMLVHSMDERIEKLCGSDGVEAHDILKHDAAQRTHLATQGEEIERLKSDKESLYAANVRLVKTYDAIVGTPCEQIRHAQEVATLQAELEGVKRERRDYGLTLTEAELNDHEYVLGYCEDFGVDFHRELVARDKAWQERDTLQQQLAEVTTERDGWAVYHDDDEPSWRHRAEKLEQQLAAREGQYNDLIMQVGKKFPDESRHETAKRYIQQHEQQCGQGGPVEALEDDIDKDAANEEYFRQKL